MKKTLLLLMGISITMLVAGQRLRPFGKKKTEEQKEQTKKENLIAAPDKTIPTVKKDWSKVDISNRAADHFMIQYGSDNWLGHPDSVRTSGFSRHFNFYFMLDKPFKTDHRFSLGIGAGIGSSNIFFKNTKVDIRSASTRLPFTSVDSTDHFTKTKVVTMYVEAPVELRYYSNPANTNKSWKMAAGVKVGTLLKSYTKSKNLVNKNGQSIYGTGYVEKESNKRFFDGTMLAVTGRVGYGIFSLDAGYQITGVLKDGTGPVMHKLSIGITISGL